jgi:hypothetical protein
MILLSTGYDPDTERAMARLTEAQIRETVERMTIKKPAVREALLRAALEGDGPTLVVLRIKARALGVVS